MKLAFAMALLWFVTVSMAAAQPVSNAAPPTLTADVEQEIATLRRLITQVEEQRWVLIPSRGSMIAISPDQAGELFVRALYEGRVSPDSVEVRARRLRTDSNTNLILLKRQLEELEAGRWPAGRAPEGSWELHCSGDYPATMRGTVYGLEVDSDGRFSFVMMIAARPGEAEHVWISPGGRIGRNYQAAGEVRWVQLSRYGEWIANRNTEATLRWDAGVQLIRRSSGRNQVDGVIHGAGSLALTDDPGGSCTGSWSAP